MPLRQDALDRSSVESVFVNPELCIGHRNTLRLSWHLQHINNIGRKMIYVSEGNNCLTDVHAESNTDTFMRSAILVASDITNTNDFHVSNKHLVASINLMSINI